MGALVQLCGSYHSTLATPGATACISVLSVARNRTMCGTCWTATVLSMLTCTWASCKWMEPCALCVGMLCKQAGMMTVPTLRPPYNKGMGPAAGIGSNFFSESAEMAHQAQSGCQRIGDIQVMHEAPSTSMCVSHGNSLAACLSARWDAQRQAAGVSEFNATPASPRSRTTVQCEPVAWQRDPRFPCCERVPCKLLHRLPIRG